MPSYIKLPRLIGLLAAWLAVTTGYAQTTLTNPSFEGTPAPHTAPPGWTVCDGTPDILPGEWGVTKPASNGSTYTGLVTQAGYKEGIGQAFAFSAGTTYSFSVDLAKSPGGSDGNYFGSTAPAVFRLWAGSSSCAESVLVWSGTIAHTAWQTYTFNFTPTVNYTHIKLQSFSSANGNVFIDNLRLVNNCPAPPFTIASSAGLSAGNNQWPLDSAFNLKTAYVLNVPDSVVRWKIKYENRPGAEAIADPSAYEFEQTGVVTLTPTSYCYGTPTAFTPASVQLTVTGGFDQEIEVKWPMYWEDTWPEINDDRPIVCEVKILKANGRLLFAGKTNGRGKLLVKGISTGDKLLVEQVAFAEQATAEVAITQSATNSNPLVINLSPKFK